MKKAQMEILGLAIVVVIILVAAVFIVRFGIKKPVDYRKDFVRSETASNILNTFLNTNARDCSQLTMTELLQDCAQGRGIICPNNQDSCQYVEATASEIFTKTLDAQNYKYEFLACVNYDSTTSRCNDLNSGLIKLGNQCTGQKDSKIFPIPINSGTMYVKLDICG